MYRFLGVQEVAGFVGPRLYRVSGRRVSGLVWD